MNKLNLIDVFRRMPTCVVMRHSDIFPDYSIPSDVDILCKDMAKCSDYLKSILQLKENIISDSQLHLDCIIDNNLHFKFDLYNQYISERYKKDALKYKSLFVIAGYVYPLWVLSEKMDNISKCYEYITYNKTKYKDFIKYKELLDEYKV